MDLKGLWALCVWTLLICTLPQSTAQCSLDLGVPFTSIPGVPFQEIFSEFSPSSFVLDGLTYLCYSRSETNSDTFSEIRVSVLYRYQSVGGTLQLTLDCRAGLGRWFYDRTRPSLDELSADQHIAENMTREGCANCRDNSTKSFGDPTYCSLPDPCTESTPACANGGTCNRTGLTEVACQCVGSWTGMGCTECNVTCSLEESFNEQMCSCECNVTCSLEESFNEQMCSCECNVMCSLEESFNEQMCSCEPLGPTAPPLSPGAIVGIVIACFALLAIILAIIAVVVIVLVVDRKSRYNNV